MSKRTVVHALFSWTDENGMPRMALRGAEIELSGAELERGDRLGAVSSDGLDSATGPVLAPEPPVAPAEAGKLLDEAAAKPSSRASSKS